jgi:hypothetical protein
MLERMVADAGGTYLMCDTDSMAIVSSEQGGLVRCNGGMHRLPGGSDAIKALTWKKVREIVDRFEALNPYDKRVIPGSILNIVQELNFDSKVANANCTATVFLQNATLCTHWRNLAFTSSK